MASMTSVRRARLSLADPRPPRRARLCEKNRYRAPVVRSCVQVRRSSRAPGPVRGCRPLAPVRPAGVTCGGCPLTSGRLMGVTVIRNTDTDIFPSTVLVMRGKASMGYLFPVLAILGLSAVNVPCAQAIEAGSNIGQTEIDKVVLREGYNPGGKSNEASPLSTGIRAYLIERAKQ